MTRKLKNLTAQIKQNVRFTIESSSSKLCLEVIQATDWNIAQ
jgi:hypothetical protein